MKKLMFDNIQKIVWKYLETLKPDEYRKALPTFNSFLDFIAKELDV